jgi:hypothetical protein
MGRTLGSWLFVGVDVFHKPQFVEHGFWSVSLFVFKGIQPMLRRTIWDRACGL